MYQPRHYSGYHSHAPFNDFFPFRKLRFGGRQSNASMTITASNSQSIQVALSSLLDSSINRNWEVRLIKSLEAPFRSSRSRTMFWSYKFTNIAQPQQHENELNINNNLYYRMNYKNLTANLLRLSLPFYYWQSHMPCQCGSVDGLLCIQFACLVFQPRSKLVRIDLCRNYVLARRMTRISAAKITCIHNKLIKSQSPHKATDIRGQLFQLPCIFRFFDFLFSGSLMALVLIRTPPSSQTFRSQKVFVLCDSKTSHVFST